MRWRLPCPCPEPPEWLWLDPELDDDELDELNEELLPDEELPEWCCELWPLCLDPDLLERLLELDPELCDALLLELNACWCADSDELALLALLAECLALECPELWLDLWLEWRLCPRFPLLLEERLWWWFGMLTPDNLGKRRARRGRRAR